MFKFAEFPPPDFVDIFITLHFTKRKRKFSDITIDISIPDLIKQGKKVGKSAILMVIMIAFMYVILTFFVGTPMALSNQFEQDIIKIAPYVEETEIKQLKSDWACMRSKADYEDIYEKINAVKDEHELP